MLQQLLNAVVGTIPEVIVLILGWLLGRAGKQRDLKNQRVDLEVVHKAEIERIREQHKAEIELLNERRRLDTEKTERGHHREKIREWREAISQSLRINESQFSQSTAFAELSPYLPGEEKARLIELQGIKGQIHKSGVNTCTGEWLPGKAEEALKINNDMKSLLLTRVEALEEEWGLK